MTSHDSLPNPEDEKSKNPEKKHQKSSFNFTAFPFVTLKLDDFFRDSALHIPEHSLKNKIPKLTLPIKNSLQINFKESGSNTLFLFWEGMEHRIIFPVTDSDSGDFFRFLEILPSRICETFWKFLK
jgi:hypothetical protein